jgi:hypothetical protein
MGVLYLISVREPASTALKLASMERGDASILLIGEARELVDNEGCRETLEQSGRIYCLHDPPKGMSLVEDMEVVDYSGWVRLIEENERIVSWT